MWEPHRRGQCQLWVAINLTTPLLTLIDHVCPRHLVRLVLLLRHFHVCCAQQPQQTSPRGSITVRSPFWAATHTMARRPIHFSWDRTTPACSMPMSLGRLSSSSHLSTDYWLNASEVLSASDLSSLGSLQVGKLFSPESGVRHASRHGKRIRVRQGRFWELDCWFGGRQNNGSGDRAETEHG